MVDEKRMAKGRSEKKTSIKEEFKVISKINVSGELTEEEKAQFRRAAFAEEMAEKTRFVVGGRFKK